ncbi:MAG: hypothetical protein K8H88_32715 [Sandaracinaceae bacterium]|nr:hypothetical protein [Sandaracinaceae bacterium]
MANARKHRRPELALAIFIAGLASLQMAHNALPYLGMRDDSCQTMFSGLEWTDRGNNHLLFPQRSIGTWRTLADVHVELDRAPASARADYLARWLDRSDRAFNEEAVRAVVAQLCDEGHRVRMRWRTSPAGEIHETQDACEVPALAEPHRWIPVRLYETDTPASAVAP